MLLHGIFEKTLHISTALNRAVMPILGVQTRDYAARKGTREKRAKKKVKVEVQKVGFIPHNERNREKMLASRPKRKFDDSWKGLSIDNVYPLRFYQWIAYPFQEAVKCHQETHHPDIFNKPNANLHVSIELNMEGEKKTRFVENFSRIAAVPHKFDHGEERAILAFTKNSEHQHLCLAAGAQLAGGVELIKQIQNGAIDLLNFNYYVADPAILAELVVLRGVMRRKFPNVKTGTLDSNVPEMVNKFIHGISYSAAKDEYEKDFGLIETVIGTLNMDIKHLEENFNALIQDVMQMKPKRGGSFINRCLLWSPPSREKLKVNHSVYLKSVKEEKPPVEVEEVKMEATA